MDVPDYVREDRMKVIAYYCNETRRAINVYAEHNRMELRFDGPRDTPQEIVQAIYDHKDVDVFTFHRPGNGYLHPDVIKEIDKYVECYTVELCTHSHCLYKFTQDPEFKTATFHIYFDDRHHD